MMIVFCLNHVRIGAGTEAFDLSKRKKTIGCRPALDQSLVLTGSEHIVRTAQHTGRRAANLYMIATHRRQIIHGVERSEEHTSEVQSLMRISYAVFCLKKKNKQPLEPPTPFSSET